MAREISDKEIDNMVAEDLADQHEKEAEYTALKHAIGNLPDPLLRRILYKIVELQK
jgi:hypothetical protein